MSDVKTLNTHHSTKLIRDRIRSVRERSGTAAVEMAVALPLLVTLVFGAIEMANAIFLRQSLNIAAYEAAKVITRPGNNESLARTRCQEVLTVRKVSTYTLTFSPAVTTSTPRGTQVTVTLSASASNLSYGPLQFMSGKTTTSTVVMVRL
ncbi:MAG TPA: TadE/TadG family type IV pilus assembly protein [Planctomycetaceae bacterium]|nr:TadE/TadG family type IV pilus assembly protein [Planctomycetaceae bacterium]